MSKKYLLVCEGPTDILVIKEIARHIDLNIIIQELSPQRDATTQRYPEHGWEEVRQWCRLYGKSLDIESDSFEALAARRRSWKAQIALASANGLIIQMDTDIVEYITDFVLSYNGTAKQARKRYAEKSVLKWLGEETKPDEIYLLLTTYSTETWLLATYERTNDVFNSLPNNFDFENVENVVELLCNLGLECYQEGNITKLSKKRYHNYAKQIVAKLQNVRRECEEANKFCNFLESD
jgi:hypothetical protein